MNKVSFLEKSIKEHDNSREGRLKDLEKKIKETKAQLQSASKDLKVGFNSAEGLIYVLSMGSCLTLPDIQINLIDDAHC